MANLCERCPMETKVAFCCSSNPETDATREVRLKRSGQIITVCDMLENDGSCGIYYDRSQDCRAFVCEDLYALGLGGQG